MLDLLTVIALVCTLVVCFRQRYPLGAGAWIVAAGIRGYLLTKGFSFHPTPESPSGTFMLVVLVGPSAMARIDHSPHLGASPFAMVLRLLAIAGLTLAAVQCFRRAAPLNPDTDEAVRLKGIALPFVATALLEGLFFVVALLAYGLSDL